MATKNKDFIHKDCFPLKGRTRLYHFLYENLPSFRSAKPVLDVRGLSEALDKSQECVYKWLRTGRLPAKNASRIAVLSQGKISEGQLLKFVLDT